MSARVWYFYPLCAIGASITAVIVRTFIYLKPYRIPNVPVEEDDSILGHVSFLGQLKMHEILMNLAKKHKSSFQLRLLGQRLLYVFDKRLVKALLRDLPDKGYPFHSPGIFQQYKNGRIIGNTFGLPYGEDWKRRRGKFRHAFSASALKHFDADVNEVVNKLCSVLDSKANTGKPLEIDTLFGQLTMDAICRVAFQFDLGGLDNSADFWEMHEQLKIAFSHAQLPIFIPCLDYLRCLRFIPLLEEFFSSSDKVLAFCRKLLTHIRDLHSKQKLPKDSLATALLEFEQMPGVVEEDLVAEILIMFVAGHETTAHSISWVVYALCKYPEIQMKAHTAMSESSGDDMSLLPAYVEAIVKESMRKYPTANGSARQVTRPEGYDVGDVHLSKGDWVNVNSFVVQNLSENWGEDVAEFKPERWLNEGDALASAAAYGGAGVTKEDMLFLPFAAGPRNCIGMNLAMLEIRATVAQLLKRYTFRFADERWADEAFAMERSITLRPKGHLPIILQLR